MPHLSTKITQQLPRRFFILLIISMATERQIFGADDKLPLFGVFKRAMPDTANNGNFRRNGRASVKNTEKW